jgi:hypothetical protein
MITVNIASLANRIDLLINTINSLIDQVDQINICLNNYEVNPYIHPKVNVVFSDNSHGDAGKFMFTTQSEGYYLTADDDLIYPPTYVKNIIEAIDKYGIVTYHGRSFKSYPISNYHRPNEAPIIRNRCLGSYDYDEPVDVGGTGCMGFHTDYFNPPFSIFKRANMADIWISCYAKQQGKLIWGLKHDADYFSYQIPETTIYDDKVNDCSFETKIINETFCK